MTKSEINEILDAYGLEMILEDSGLVIADVVDILEELGFIDLEQYRNDD